MLFLLAFLPLLEPVNGASSFANSTITKPATLSLSTTASAVATSSQSCLYPVKSGLYAPYFDCNRPGDPELPTNASNPYDDIVYRFSDPLASQCSSSYENSFSSWMATAIITTQTVTYSDQVSELPYTTEAWVHFDGGFSYKAAEPCCYNCSLYGGDVQVYYWPTPAPTPGVTKLVDAANNFTFTSPSVYVVFNSLYATNLCGHVGEDIPLTTLAFDPGQLSTALAYHDDEPGPVELYNPFTQASFGTEPTVCGNVTSSFEGYIILFSDPATSYSADALPASLQSSCSETPESCDYEEWQVTYDPCSPTLSVPSQLFTLNPEWKSCIQGISAFFDPPYTLTKGGTLSAFSATADPASPTAQPQTTANAPTPTPTPTSSSDPSLSPDPSPSADPTPSPDPSPSQDPSASADPSPPPNPNPSPSVEPSPSLDPSPSPNQNPSPSPNPSPSADPSPIADPSPNQGTTSPQGQPQTQPQATPDTSPADPNNPIQTPTTTLIPFVAGTQTIIPGSLATIISGTTYSFPSSGGAVIINNSITQSIPQPQASTLVPFVVGTQTITPGSLAAVISGTTYSIPSSGGAVIINNSITQPIPQPGQSGSDSTPTYVLGSQTLVAGGAAITVSSSIVLSLLSGGQSVVVEGSNTTETLAITAVFTSTEEVLETGTSTGLGGVIASIGGFSTPTSTSVTGNGTAGYTGITFQGAGSRINGKESLCIWVMGAGVAMLGILVL